MRFNFSLIYLQSYDLYLQGGDISLATMKDKYEPEGIRFYNLNTDGSTVAVDEPKSFIVYGNCSYFLRDTPPTAQEMLDYCNMCIMAGHKTADMYRGDNILSETANTARDLRQKLLISNPPATTIDEAIRGVGLYDNLHKTVSPHVGPTEEKCIISGGKKTKRNSKRKSKTRKRK